MNKKRTEELSDEKPVVHFVKGDDEDMLPDEYSAEDLGKGVKNPFAGKIKKQITIRIEPETIEYFKKQAAETGIPYQTLINYVLNDYVKNDKVPKIIFE